MNANDICQWAAIGLLYIFAIASEVWQNDHKRDHKYGRKDWDR